MSDLVVITGGGTGGHVYPAIALAEALRSSEPPFEVTMVGSASGPEGDAAKAAGIAFEGISLGGISGKKPLEKMTAAFLFARGTAGRLAWLRRRRPLCVIGTGGYAAAPTCFASVLSRVPLILHEMNTVPGMVTRYLSVRAYAVATAFEKTAGCLSPRARVVTTGVPVRRAITALADEGARSSARAEGLEFFDLSPGGRTLLVSGGSQGAGALNGTVWDAIEAGGLPSDLRVLHITGRSAYGDIRRSAAEGVAGGDVYRAVPYLERMELAYAVSDLALSRAGAGTLAELAAAGLPAVLVPYPHAAAGHQDQNAEALQSAGAALVVEQKGESAAGAFVAALSLLDDPEARGRMASSLSSVGLGRGTEGIVALVEELREGRHEGGPLENGATVA
ncbi:MAG: undecaprenyldiphospho-muramoylpentapeptide beta-N-acetylglucosaminyltransferase [Actinomycetota bacterium]